MSTINVFDPITKNTQTINVLVESAVLEGDGDAAVDYFIKFTTNARKVSGAVINPLIMRRLTSLVRTEFNPPRQHDGITTTPYATMTKGIEDYILHMIEGTGGADAMEFNI